MSDTVLAEELSRNLDTNYEKFVQAYQDRIFSFALRLTQHRQDAEDVTQEGFVRAYRALKSYPVDRIKSMDLKPWLYRIVLNVFRNRRRGYRPVIEPLNEMKARSGPEGMEEAQGSPQALVEASEMRMQIGVALAALPEKYRVPVILRHMEGLAYGRLGEILGQPVGSIKSNVHRGLQMLRKALVRQTKEKVR